MSTTSAEGWEEGHCAGKDKQCKHGEAGVTKLAESEQQERLSGSLGGAQCTEIRWGGLS